MLSERADSVYVPSTAHARTMRRARRRRLGTSGIAAVLAVTMAAGAFAALRSTGSSDPIRPATPHKELSDEYEFSSGPVGYPYVAKGKFREAIWSLRGDSVEVAPGIDEVRLALTVSLEPNPPDARNVVTAETVVTADDDPLLVEHVDLERVLGNEADVVFGAALPDTASVEVEVENGRRHETIPAHLFEEYDSRSTITASYFVAFVPSGMKGFVAARDDLGTDLGVESIRDGEPRPKCRPACDVHPREAIASGKVDGGLWRLRFSGTNNQGCVVVDRPKGSSSSCFSPEELDQTMPLFVNMHSGEKVEVVTALLRSGSGIVRFRTRAGREGTLRPFPVPPDLFEQWPYQIVVLGIEPDDADGTLELVGPGGEVLAERDF